MSDTAEGNALVPARATTAGGALAMPQEKVELLKRTICKGATNDELELFIHACNRTGLDPFMRQIHAVKRWNADLGREVMTIQTGIDGYRLTAERSGAYMPGQEPTFQYDAEGYLVRATAYVKKLDARGAWHEIAASAHWDEYVGKKKDGSPTAMWRDKPHVMLGKCAEALALRRAFPAELSGIYTREEMDQADPPQPEPPAGNGSGRRGEPPKQPGPQSDGKASGPQQQPSRGPDAEAEFDGEAVVKDDGAGAEPTDEQERLAIQLDEMLSSLPTGDTLRAKWLSAAKVTSLGQMPADSLRKCIDAARAAGSKGKERAGAR